MASMGMQLLASAMCLLGWAGVIISCLLPMWRVTAFVGTTIITVQTIWDGIWMACVSQSTGEIQCKPYESVLALSYDVQASRVLMILSIGTGGAGLILAFIGGKCTRFLDEHGPRVKWKVALVAGAVLIAAGLLCCIAITWAGGIVVRNFYSITTTDGQRRELGACLYIGWGASILLILGGGMFISSAYPLKGHDADRNPSVRYVVVRSSKGSNRTGSHHSRAPSVNSQPGRAVFAYPQSSRAPSIKPRLDRTASWEDVLELDSRHESNRSWAPSTKSQMKTQVVPESVHSEEPSTKSQLKEEMEDNLSAESENEEGSSNPGRTYI